MHNARWLTTRLYAYTADPPKEPAMLIVADENIPLLDAFFASFGEIRRVPGVPSTVPPSNRPMCCWCAR
jgi:erythronate-4-phosphate dehydrogenase